MKTKCISKMLCVFLQLAMINYFMGCWITNEKSIFQNEFPNDSKFVVKDVLLFDRTNITFNEHGGLYVRNTDSSGNYCAVLGVDNNGKRHEINLNKIYLAHVERREFNSTGTGIYAALLVPALFIASTFLWLALHPIHSCPFIYSYDGKDYRFESQSFAGAITKGLERDDYAKLNHLKPVLGEYQIMMRNDPPDETQYIRNVNLLLIDHSPNTRVICGYDGKFYEYEKINAPVSAKDENGKDLSGLVSLKDDIFWESPMNDLSKLPSDYENHLEFKFIKPSIKDSVRLIFRIGTTFLGSEMIRTYINLLGRKADEFYRKIDEKNIDALKKFKYLVEDEELYHMKVNVLNGNEYIPRGIIKSNGSLFMEERIITLNVKDIPGDTLTVRLNPPYGFWKIDYINIAGESIKEILPTYTVQPYLPLDKLKNKLKPAEENNESYFYIMNEQNETIWVYFDNPGQKQGLQRETFLKTRGYYRIHNPENIHENFRLFERFFENKVNARKFAIETYIEWKRNYFCEKP